ncbi:ATP-grasp domain-containing protein [Candidatus Babeliales bacterium]|nr:ATP-grasp domain-containing protein [Candidatus Babeliales bacterium]
MNINKKLRIGVLMGGMNLEREVSFNSGRTICDHLDTNIYDVVPIFQTEQGDLYLLPWHFLHRGKIADFMHRLSGEAKLISWDLLKDLIDFAYIAMHGRYAEDGILQGMLEIQNIPYLGAKVFASALGMDKAFHKDILKANGLLVPAGIVVRGYQVDTLSFDVLMKRLDIEQVTFPCIVKPAHEGSSFGVSVVHEPEALLEAIKKAAYVNQVAQDVIVEQKIDGMEFVCVSVQKHNNGSTEWFSFPITQVIPESGSEFFDYEQKYMPGRAAKITPALCSEHDTQNIMRTSERAADVLGFRTIARIDGILARDGGVYFIDPNSLTGMGPATFLFHQAAEIGMSHAQLINFLIASELRAYGIQTTLHVEKDQNMLAQQEKIRIVVLLGGDSNEREISLESGRNVCYKLSPNKYEVIPVFVHESMQLYKLSQRMLIQNSTREISALISDDIKIAWSDLPTIADFVFIALHGGKGENGAVQGALEMLKMPYNGSGVLASALCMNKYQTNSFLKQKGFDVPKNYLLKNDEWLAKSQLDQEAFVDQLAASFAYPLIIKPSDDGCSVGVHKVMSKQEALSCINNVFALGKRDVMIEECVRGMELTCGVYGNDNPIALPPSYSVAKDTVLSIQEKFLPGDGQNITPAPIDVRATALVQQTLQDVYQVVGCKGYARIDCFYQTAEQSITGYERVVILEINTLPGLTPATCLFHQVAETGSKPMAFIDKIVELGFQLHGHKKTNHYHGAKEELYTQLSS